MYIESLNNKINFSEENRFSHVCSFSKNLHI